MSDCLVSMMLIGLFGQISVCRVNISSRFQKEPKRIDITIIDAKYCSVLNTHDQSTPFKSFD